jgi:hypothetical protein
VARRAVVAVEPGPEPGRIDLETAGALWWSALEAAEGALRAASTSLTAEERRELAARLATERVRTVQLLDEVARLQRIRTRFSYLLAQR